MRSYPKFQPITVEQFLDIDFGSDRKFELVGGVYCGNPASIERERLRIFSGPVFVIEVLSPSTTKDDLGSKLDEYRQLASLDTIAFVNPDKELVRVVQRLGPTAWRDDLFTQPHDMELPSLALTIPHTEIFARD